MDVLIHVLIRCMSVVRWWRCVNQNPGNVINVSNADRQPLNPPPSGYTLGSSRPTRNDLNILQRRSNDPSSSDTGSALHVQLSPSTQRTSIKELFFESRRRWLAGALHPFHGSMTTHNTTRFTVHLLHVTGRPPSSRPSLYSINCHIKAIIVTGS